jgi:transposase
MSLNAPLFTLVPDDTARVARAAFPKGHPYLRIRDTFGAFFAGPDFRDLFEPTGRPAIDPARLALVTILQFAERLSDDQAAHAVAGRIDWKYLLSLPLDAAGFDPSVLSEFRDRLLDGQAELRLFDTLLSHFRDAGLLRSRGRQRSDSTHVLAVVRALNRLETVSTTLRNALNQLAVLVPSWLRAHAPAEWRTRYGPRLVAELFPDGEAARDALALQIGNDGITLVRLLRQSDTLAALDCLEALATLRQVWLHNYVWDKNGQLAWRDTTNLPPASQRINSPYDAEARRSKKRSTSWVGYKVHLSESCDEDLPHLITNVETTSATQPDQASTAAIHQALCKRDLVPSEHVVDSGYIDAELLVESERTYKMELLGPVRTDTSWQARAGEGYAAADFELDWQGKQARCPMGKVSEEWNASQNRHGQVVAQIKFAQADCQGCVVRAKCTKGRRRQMVVQPEAQDTALKGGRARQKTGEFKRRYRKRAGVEGTMSQGVRRCGIRQARYRGLAKTRLQHLATASALNLIRVAAWLDEQPHAKTRYTAFERLYCSTA